MFDPTEENVNEDFQVMDFENCSPQIQITSPYYDEHEKAFLNDIRNASFLNDAESPFLRSPNTDQILLNSCDPFETFKENVHETSQGISFDNGSPLIQATTPKAQDHQRPFGVEIQNSLFLYDRQSPSVSNKDKISVSASNNFTSSVTNDIQYPSIIPNSETSSAITGKKAPHTLSDSLGTSVHEKKLHVVQRETNNNLSPPPSSTTSSEHNFTDYFPDFRPGKPLPFRRSFKPACDANISGAKHKGNKNKHDQPLSAESSKQGPSGTNGNQYPSIIPSSETSSAVTEKRAAPHTISDSLSISVRGKRLRIVQQETHNNLSTLLSNILFSAHDITDSFPGFRPCKPRRFQKICKPTYNADIWGPIRERNKRNRDQSLSEDSREQAESHTSQFSNALKGLNVNIPESPPPPELVESDDEEKMRNNRCESFHHRNETSAFDTYDVSHGKENINSKVNSCKSNTAPKDDYPDEAYLMVNQVHWEDDIIWDGGEVKKKVPKDIYGKELSCGWVPAAQHRTWSEFKKYKKQPIPPALHPDLQQPLKTCKTSSTSVTENDANEKQWSLLPIENPNLLYGNWEDGVIWDGDDVDLNSIARPFAIDPSDDNLIPDDSPPEPETSNELTTSLRNTTHKSVFLSGKSDSLSESEAPSTSLQHKVKKDPFNISNDEYYNPKIQPDSLLKSNLAKSLIQHSTPAVQLYPPFFPTHMDADQLRKFHRPSFKNYTRGNLAKPGFHNVMSLHGYIEQKTALREQERQLAGGGTIFCMREVKDLSSKDGELLLFEYSEEHIPLMMQVGMATRLINFYKRMPGTSEQEQRYKYGETVYVHKSPFLGELSPGNSIQALENNLFRAPVYEHDLVDTDFLLLRTRNQYYIREVNALFTVGQQIPLLEVPAPTSKAASDIFQRFLEVTIYRLFWKSKDKPRRLKVEELKRAFPSYSENTIRRQLKGCAEYGNTHSRRLNFWKPRKGFRLPPEEEIQSLLSPEQCCLYYSMLAGKQRLKDVGYGESSFMMQEDESEMQANLEEEVKTAPWNTTKACISAMKGKCILELAGVADPTGFSYVKSSNKTAMLQTEARIQPKLKEPIAGTDVDLRKITTDGVKRTFRKFSMPEEEIENRSRWDLIHKLQSFSTKQAEVCRNPAKKYVRNKPMTVEQQREQYKTEIQRLFDLQNQILASKEIISTDEESGSAEDDPELEEMGKAIESMLLGEEAIPQLLEEREEREELKLLMSNGEKRLGREKGGAAVDRAHNATNVNKVLKICRTYHTEEGETFERLEIVRNPHIVTYYDKLKKTKDSKFIEEFSRTESEKEEMRKERRKNQCRLRKLKNIAGPRPLPFATKIPHEQPLSSNVKICDDSRIGGANSNPVVSSFKKRKYTTFAKNSTNIGPVDDARYAVKQVSGTKLIISRHPIKISDALESRKQSVVHKYK